MALRGRLVALEGPSGVGKSTTARYLSDRSGWGTLSEAFVRLEPSRSLAFGSVSELITIEEALLDEEWRRYREARRRCRRGENVVADTGFLGPLTYTAGLVALGRSPPSALATIGPAVRTRFFQGELGWPDGIIYLDLAPAELLHRSSNDPLGHSGPLAARHHAVGRFERGFYLGFLMRRWPGRVVRVPASAPPHAVAQRVGAIASGFPPSEPSLEETMAVIDRLVERPRPAAPRAARTPATLKRGTRPLRPPRR